VREVERRERAQQAELVGDAPRDPVVAELERVEQRERAELDRQRGQLVVAQVERLQR
jgi:hypothetical protein